MHHIAVEVLASVYSGESWQLCTVVSFV